MTNFVYEKRAKNLIGPNSIRIDKMGFRDDSTGIWWPKFECPECHMWFFAFLEDIVLGDITNCPSCGNYEPIFLEEVETEQRRQKALKRKLINNGLLKRKIRKIPPVRCASKGEYEVYKILFEENISFQMQYVFEDCINPKTNHLLYFDFYIPDKNICIEYDGRQHFEPIDFFGGEEAFEKRVYRDNIKNEYCKKNNIKLIRIRYDCSDIKNYLLKNIK